MSGPTNTFELGYRLVLDNEGSSRDCRVNRYGLLEQNASFSSIKALDGITASDEQACAQACTASNSCRAFRATGCLSGVKASDDLHACSGQCVAYANSEDNAWPGYTLTTLDGGDVLGADRCYARREDGQRQVVMLPPAFTYGMSYTFEVKPFNTIGSAGSFGYTPSTSTATTCAAVPFRPAAPTASAPFVLDRKAFITWETPAEHGGGSVEQYLYQICHVPDGEVRDCADIAPSRCAANPRPNPSPTPNPNPKRGP